jgi:hypothetical protein
MRILHRNIKVSRIIFHPYTSFLYFLVFAYFVYLNFKLFPMWEGVQERLSSSKQIYEKKLLKKQNLENKAEIISTEEGQKRYQKDFFNKLDDGEKIIILYSDEKKIEEKEVEEIRNLTRLEKTKQQIKLWWANF